MMKFNFLGKFNEISYGMDRRKLVKFLVYLIFFILIMNFIADKFHWYYSIWYFDVIMHFLGGFWVGLVFFYLFSPQNISIKFISKILLFILFVGIGWEIFEILVNEVVYTNPFDYLDTASDIFFDLVGGIVATLYFFKRIMLH